MTATSSSKMSAGQPLPRTYGGRRLVALSDVERRAAERRTWRWRREQRIQALGFPDYEAYIRSPEWAEVRTAYWNDPDTSKACVLCGTNESPLALHHRTYERVGREQQEDLSPACVGCHDLIHSFERCGVIEHLGADVSFLADPERAVKYRVGAPKRFDSEKIRSAKKLAAEITKLQGKLREAESKGQAKTVKTLERQLRRVRGKAT